MIRLVAAGVAATIAVAAAASAEATSARKASLRLVAAAPVTFRGLNFKRGERIVVDVTAGRTIRVRTRAGRTGTFTVRMRGLHPTGCSGLAASAVGDRGSRAAYKRPPAPCALP